MDVSGLKSDFFNSKKKNLHHENVKFSVTSCLWPTSRYNFYQADVTIPYSALTMGQHNTVTHIRTLTGCKHTTFLTLTLVQSVSRETHRNTLPLPLSLARSDRIYGYIVYIHAVY